MFIILYISKEANFVQSEFSMFVNFENKYANILEYQDRTRLKAFLATLITRFFAKSYFCIGKLVCMAEFITICQVSVRAFFKSISRFIAFFHCDATVSRCFNALRRKLCPFSKVIPSSISLQVTICVWL